MSGTGVLIVVAAVIASMVIAFIAYSEYQPNLVTGTAGEAVIVGPTEYIITFEGTNEGTKETSPTDTFVKIGIVAKNISDEETFLSGGQFFINYGGKNHEAIYGGFSDEELQYEKIEPGEEVQRTTQFDVPFDEEKQHDIIIRPLKEQSSLDLASVCIINC